MGSVDASGPEIAAPGSMSREETEAVLIATVRALWAAGKILEKDGKPAINPGPTGLVFNVPGTPVAADYPARLGGISITLKGIGAAQLTRLEMRVHSVDEVLPDWPGEKPVEAPQSKASHVVRMKPGQTLGELAGDRVALIDFNAPWCGPCRQLEPVVEQIAAELAADLLIVSVNTDVHPDVAEAFGIKGVPTFVLTRGGKEIQGRGNRLSGPAAAAVREMAERGGALNRATNSAPHRPHEGL